MAFPLTPWLRHVRGRSLQVWYDPAYRLPIPSLEPTVALDLRRADLVAWHLVQCGAILKGDLRTPTRIGFDDLALVHTAEYLERLDDPGELARIFSVETEKLPVASTLDTVRLACGGTLAAAREALRSSRATLNLLGGFHHAGRAFGGGLCALNDVAVALAVLRREGWQGVAIVLDLDAHPPDGLADCLPDTWIGSISGSSWGPLAGVDETVLPAGTTGGPYLEALTALLARTPRSDLAFVIAGGDVLAGDRLGALALDRADVRECHLRVHRFLAETASVWLPAGGYSSDAWRLLAETAVVLATGRAAPIDDAIDPLRMEFARVARGLARGDLGGADDIDMSDVLADLGMSAPGPVRLLDYYSASGIELAFERYGLLGALRRLGYDTFRFAVDRVGMGDRLRVFGEGRGEEHLLLESVMAKEATEGRTWLYLHWLTLRHPLSAFTAKRPRLPGQEVPGLGLSREILELCGRIAVRLSFAGVAFRPAWYHIAFAGRHDFRFLDPARQGRFQALVRDLGSMPLRDATRAVVEQRVLLDGRPYVWEPDLMVAFVAFDDARAVDRARDQTRFTLAPTT